MTRELIIEIKEGLAAEGINVSDFVVEKIDESNLTVVVSADKMVYVIELDQYYEEAEIIDTYPLDMLRREQRNG